MINRNRPHPSQHPRSFAPISAPRSDLFIQKENILPNQMPKPLISPKSQLSDRLSVNRHPPKTHSYRSNRSPPSLSCCNHPTKKAQFLTYVQEGEQYFCGRCAAQLATQGCKVEALQMSSSQGMRVSKKNQLPHLPQFEHEPIYQEIMSILKLCNSVVADHNSNLEQFASLEEEYGQQADLTSAFYDRLIEIIEEMKADHLSDLMQERDKYTQIAEIENDNIRQNIIEINTIKSDIEGNMEQVLEGIRNSGDPSQCRESLEHYRQKLTLYHHQTEQQLESLTQVTRYSQPLIDSMLVSFENFLAQMWEEAQGTSQQAQHPLVQPPRQQKQLNSAMTVKNIHQILPRAVAYENHESKRAFRNLEAQEEEQELQERKSPNFKKI